MGSALLEGVVRSGFLSKEECLAYDADEARLVQVVERLKVPRASDLTELLTACSAILLCIKPQQMEACLESCRRAPAQRLFLSIAAGVTLSTYERFLPQHPWVRVMPNTPAQVGEGVSALSFNAFVKEPEKEFARGLFSSVGSVVEVPEAQLDAVTALSGSGPGFLSFLLEGMIEAGKECGLPSSVASQLTIQTALGTAKLLLEKQLSPKELQTRVASPGGTTEAGLKVLREGGVQKVLKDAVSAAAQRSQEISK